MALLALADLGHCEEDGAMSWPGSHANAVSVLPVGTDAEVQAEVRAARPQPARSASHKKNYHS